MGYETCKRCQGNGEIVVDWPLYLHGNDDENAVTDCPDCDGTGTIPPQYAQDRPHSSDHSTEPK